MTPYVAPLFTLFVWWVSTGVILYLDGLPRRTFRWSMIGATLALAGACYGLFVTRNNVTVAGAYGAFSGAVLVWAWQEVAFLLGFVTGPSREPCPPACRGWRRAGYALQTILYHEFALIVLAIAVYALTRGGANSIGWWTFCVLWAMRQSAKLNLFLGVRNLSEEFLPDHLRFLRSYFRRRAMNPLFPVSLAASAAMSVLVWQRVAAADPGTFEAVGFSLVGTLLALAMLEHAFMLLPLPAEVLWRWGLSSRSQRWPSRTSDERAPALQSWSTPLPGPCDPTGLRELLEACARGAFGDVDRINGVARARCGWIHFELVQGRARVASFAPRARQEPRAIAIGRRVDEARLQAAFDACAATA